MFLRLKSVHVFTSWKQKYTRLLKSSLDISCISHFNRITVMDTSFHASENDFICEDCGKCLKSRSCLGWHRPRQHLKQEMKSKCTTDSCTAAFCEKGELLAHQTSHGEQKRITCNYCGHKLSGNIKELMRQIFFHMLGEDYIFRTTHIFTLDQMTIIVIVCKLIIKI
jgi:hypothetical protein